MEVFWTLTDMKVTTCFVVFHPWAPEPVKAVAWPTIGSQIRVRNEAVVRQLVPGMFSGLSEIEFVTDC